VGFTSFILYEFTVLIFLNDTKQYLNIGVDFAFGCLSCMEVDCVVDFLDTNAASVFWVNVNGCNQVKQAGHHSVPWVGEGKTIAWFGQI
jgi:hypothetical protein